MGMMIHRRKLREKTKANDIKETPKMKEVVETNVFERPKSDVLIEDIKKLPYFSLKSLASRYGVDVKGKKTEKIREELIAKVEG